MRKFIYLPLHAMSACATTNVPTVIARPTTTNVADAKDPSVLKWTRLYCTPDHESHFETMTVALGAKNFAPPASPIFIGGGGSASKVVFGGFEENWGAADVQS